MANNLKSLEVSKEKAVKREASYKDQIKSLTVKLKQNTAGAEFAERSVQKLQKEVRFGSFGRPSHQIFIKLLFYRCLGYRIFIPNIRDSYRATAS